MAFDGERTSVVPHEPAFLRVRSWERYQVYHDGRPTKFFSVQAVTDPKTGRTGILDDPAFLRLLNDPECPVFLVMAYAAQTGNKIPNDPVFLRAKLLTEYPVNVVKMLESRFLEPWKPEEKTPANGGCTDPYESLPREEKNREEKKPPLPPLAADAAAVRDLFDYWQEKRGKPRSKLTENRRQKIRKRLREFTSEELKRCIDGVALDPWEDRSRHDDLAIIFRSQEQVEKFIALSENVDVMSRDERLRRHFDSLKERGVT